MKKYIIKSLLISYFLIGCETSSGNHNSFEIINQMDNHFPKETRDSIYLLVPTQACFECSRNSLQLVELFGDKPNCSIVFYGNTESRDFQILFKSEIRKYSNLILDTDSIWENYYSDDPVSIWVVFSSWENLKRFKVKLTEENILLLEDRINLLSL
jgi:hypothetical protein